MNCVVFLNHQNHLFHFPRQTSPATWSTGFHWVSLKLQQQAALRKKKCLNSPHRYRHRPLQIEDFIKVGIFASSPQKKNYPWFYPKSARCTSLVNPWPSQWWMAYGSGIGRNLEPGAWRPNPWIRCACKNAALTEASGAKWWETMGFDSRSKFKNTTLCWTPPQYSQRKAPNILKASR